MEPVSCCCYQIPFQRFCPEKTTLSNSEFCSIMNSTMRYSCFFLGRCFRLYVYEAILYLDHKFGTVTGKKKRNHSPNGHSETRKGYSNPFFQNFPTDFLFGMWKRRYDHIIDDVPGVDAEAFFLSAQSLAWPCIRHGALCRTKGRVHCVIPY